MKFGVWRYMFAQHQYAAMGHKIELPTMNLIASREVYPRLARLMFGYNMSK